MKFKLQLFIFLNFVFRLGATRSIILLYMQALATTHKTKLVGSSGLEPPTSRLSGVRSNHLSYEPVSWSFDFLPSSLPCLQLLLSCFCVANWVSSPSTGGDKRDRTADPLLAKQVLSQLSYTPISFGAFIGPLRTSKIKQRF